MLRSQSTICATTPICARLGVGKIRHSKGDTGVPARESEGGTGVTAPESRAGCACHNQLFSVPTLAILRFEGAVDYHIDSRSSFLFRDPIVMTKTQTAIEES